LLLASFSRLLAAGGDEDEEVEIGDGKCTRGPTGGNVVVVDEVLPF
jgi:hypothetical protein